jgi:SAM-dependent methyltransferase
VRPVENYTRLAGVYDEVVVDPCHDAWAAFLDELFRADEDAVRDVLDVCCGTGLLAAELVARGYRVTGVDASEAMLGRARRLLGPEPRLIRATLPDLPLEETALPTSPRRISVGPSLCWLVGCARAAGSCSTPTRTR